MRQKKKTEALIQSRIKENEVLLASKQAAIEAVKSAQAKIDSELEIQKATSAEVEKQIARKKSLVLKDEYIAKCLQQLALRKREIMPLGPASYFVDAAFGMKFLLKETFLVSSYVKTQIREQSAAIRKHQNDVLARVQPRFVKCRSLLSNGMSSFVRSFGVNVKLTAPKPPSQATKNGPQFSS